MGCIYSWLKSSHKAWKTTTRCVSIISWFNSTMFWCSTPTCCHIMTTGCMMVRRKWAKKLYCISQIQSFFSFGRLNHTFACVTKAAFKQPNVSFIMQRMQQWSDHTTNKLGSQTIWVKEVTQQVVLWPWADRLFSFRKDTSPIFQPQLLGNKLMGHSRNNETQSSRACGSTGTEGEQSPGSHFRHMIT